MGSLTYPATITPNTNEDVGQLNSNLNAIQAVINGGIDNTNLSATAGVKESQLATGATGLATGAFSAYRAAALSLASGATVVFDTEEFDVSAWHNVATGRYTPLVAGYYRLSWAAICGTTLPVDLHWSTYLDKNGAGAKAGAEVYQRGSRSLRSVGSAIVQMNGSTDNVGVVVDHGNGATATALTVGAFYTWFQGELIGRS